MKKNPKLNDYERAFGNWLRDNRIQCLAIDERKRASLGHSKLKSFDYLLYPKNQQILIAEVKGRQFKGNTFTKLAGFQNWVTFEDVVGLSKWQEVFGSGYKSAFVFAYKIANVDVDFDGRDAYEFEGNRYIFFGVMLDNYERFMKVRSQKWKTVHLPADIFRQYSFQLVNQIF